ncbi:MAG: lipocalin family protein [Sphingobacterium hotanense]
MKYLLITVCLLPFISCSKNDSLTSAETALVGDWKSVDPDYGSIWSFESNRAYTERSYILFSKLDHLRLLERGNYKVIENSLIRNSDGGASYQSKILKLTKDSLILQSQEDEIAGHKLVVKKYVRIGNDPS